MDDAPPRPRSRRLRLLVTVWLVAVAATGLLAVLRLAAPGGAQATVDLVATRNAGDATAPRVSHVLLTGGGNDVLLAESVATVARAPQLSDVGVRSVPERTYTGMSALVDGRQVSAPLHVSLHSGGVTPLLLVVHGGAITAAAGNDDVNHAALAAAGQLIHPPDVTFVDQHGAPVPLHSLHGRVLVVAALDAHCHDSCPLYTALWADLQRVIRERGWASRVALAEVSMDPGRDTPEELAAYGRMVDATWPLLTADPDSTYAFWTTLGARYHRSPSPSPAPIDWYTGKPETYHLDHDSLAVVFDQSGDARYILQGNPRLGHDLTPALARLLDGRPLAALQSPTSWSFTDLLDRVDTLLGAPLEYERGTEQAARAGSRVPDVGLIELDGRRLALRSQLGRAMVVTFWATWCAPCRHDMPLLAAAVRAHPGLLVVAVDEGESSGQISDYLHSVLGDDASQLTVVRDADKSVGARFAVQGLPVTVFVGADGIVRTVRIGQLQAGDLGSVLAATGA